MNLMQNKSESINLRYQGFRALTVVLHTFSTLLLGHYSIKLTYNKSKMQ